MTSEPERTCIGCRRTDGRTRLVRLVLGATGEIGVDASGRAPGRGAYVHPDQGCAEAATRKGVLARALRTGIEPDELGRLRTTMSQGAL
jgi:predicted RNA-binding protein YlxR (DUF448 family)